MWSELNAILWPLGQLYANVIVPLERGVVHMLLQGSSKGNRTNQGWPSSPHDPVAATWSVSMI